MLHPFSIRKYPRTLQPDPLLVVLLNQRHVTGQIQWQCRHPLTLLQSFTLLTEDQAASVSLCTSTRANLMPSVEHLKQHQYQVADGNNP